MVRFCKNKMSLAGKTAVITGANSGLGFETALEFARRECRVILACRSQERAEKARNKIIEATGNSNIVIKLIDMESLTSVRNFAQDLLETEERLDLLINNAGTMMLPEKITEDGLQLNMAVNYFSSFLLTMLLLDILKKSIPSRVINVSSVAAIFSPSFKPTPKGLNKYGGFRLYGKTKLCQIYFTQEFAKRMEDIGVTMYSLNPGGVYTEAVDKATKHGKWFIKKFSKTPYEGIQTIVYLALEDGIEKYNGEHFEDCKKVKPYCKARNAEKAKKLWEVTEEMVGLRKGEN